MYLHPPCSIEQVRELQRMEDPGAALPFIGHILGALRAEVGSEATVLGFVGAPWTLAAYAIEGNSSRQVHLSEMRDSPSAASAVFATASMS